MLSRNSSAISDGKLGPSGSGKSTFLNILAYRVPVKHVRGTVAINSQPLTKEVSKHFGYVMQDDVLHENLTVREVRLHFRSSAKF